MMPDGAGRHSRGATGHAVRTATRDRIADERGVSVLELLTAASMMVIILGAMIGLYSQAVQGERRTDGRVRGLAQQQLGMERVLRELRQATGVNAVTSQTVDVDTYVRQISGTSTPRRVKYECTSGSCKRYETTVNGIFPSTYVTVITSVENVDIFDMTPDYINPTYVAMKVEVTADEAENPISLSGGVQFKNLAGARSS